VEFQPPGFGPSGNGFGNSHFVLSSHLIDPSSGLLRNDTLRIYCKMTIYGDAKHQVSFPKDSSRLVEKSDKKNQIAVLNDFGAMLNDEVWSDVEIVVGEKRFKAHKSILSGTKKYLLGNLCCILFCC